MENPPPPPGEESSRDSQFDPRRNRFVFPQPAAASTEPIGCAGRIALILLGIVSFVMAIGLFAAVLASGQPAIGLVVAVGAMVALFVIRKKSGPSPALGAVMVGVGVAVVVFGGCMLILMTTKFDFK